MTWEVSPPWMVSRTPVVASWGTPSGTVASKNPGSVPDERFYAGLVDAFAAWLRH
ncbi:hypothetical protein [Streptomyces mirabilis]|uniref:hypothetical protein n=1 Tax=Streptomyces mirabilis TaxID=68239 RepID=UPI0033CE81B8